MKHLREAPQGAPAPIKAQNGQALPDGWRKVTVQSVQTERLAQTGMPQGISKSRAMVAVKRIGVQIGLKAADMMLLDTLGAFSQPQDWEAGRRAIVWPSNACLMAQTGFSLSALKRHIRRLAQAGVIGFHDSPNGKRWGRRGRDGVIGEAYGFDLTPLGLRAGDYEDLYAQRAAERAECKRLRRQITVARRMIRARLETAADEMGPLRQTFETVLKQLPKPKDGPAELSAVNTKFQSLLQQVQAHYLEAERPDAVSVDPKMNPSGASFEPHIQTTNKLKSSDCNREQRPVPEPVKEVSKKIEKPINLRLVLEACPEFAGWAGSIMEPLRDWGDLHRIAGRLGPMIGIGAQVWEAAQVALGKQHATAALALVFEKHSAGQVASPTGYLRGMLRKAGAGELHLERSLFGRVRALA